MDLEQIIKRLEWLDEERRNDKMQIASLQERQKELETEALGMAQQLKDMGGQYAHLQVLVARFNEIENTIGQFRIDYLRKIEESEKLRMEHEREVEKNRTNEIDLLNKNYNEIRKNADLIPEIKKNLQIRMEEEFRLGKMIEEMESFMEAERLREDEDRRVKKLLEEGRKQDTKRLLDMQSEVLGLRKRADEQRGKIEFLSDTFKKLEIRLSELQSSETERRQALNTFTEKQSLLQVERDRVWKEWQERFERFTTQTVDMDAQLQALEATHRAVRRSQEALDEITQRFDRRINELTEMQRLNEERFRQEWAVFNGDDQKRWTNYTLIQEEQQREMNRRYEKQADRIVYLEDTTQEMRDMLQQLTTDIQKQMQTALEISRAWLEGFDHYYGKLH